MLEAGRGLDLALLLLLGLLALLRGENLSRLVLVDARRRRALETWREVVLVDEELGDVIVEAWWAGGLCLLTMVGLRLLLTLLKLVRLGGMVEEAGWWAG